MGAPSPTSCPAVLEGPVILEIVQAGDPILFRPARTAPVEHVTTPEMQELIASMIQTMRAARGVGLAAPQVGQGLRLFVMEDTHEFTIDMSEAWRNKIERSPFDLIVCVNPRLEILSSESRRHFEGCLSIKGYSGLVERAHAVRVTGLDSRGKHFDKELRGWPARIAQHEYDHLEGLLYVDKMSARSFATNANMGRFRDDLISSEDE